MKTILLLVGCVMFAQSQNNVPFASQNNAIELSVANTSMVAAENVTVEATSAPQWLNITNRKLTIENLNSGESKIASFTFSVDKSAPVNKPEQVTFSITNSDGQSWTKILSLQVSPPEKFELFQNYPNPFNPTTIISYQIPQVGDITLKIFDILGKDVETIDEGIKEAGYHQKEWNAANVASGMYMYQLALTNSEGKKEFFRKKMLILK